MLPETAEEASEDRESHVRARPPERHSTDGSAPGPAASRAKTLVDALIELGPGEIAPVVGELLPLGDHALAELVKSFPGPVWRPSLRTDSRLPRPSEISASAAALMAFDDRAVPYLAELTRHPSPEVRYYALVCCKTVEAAGLVDALARAATDPDRDCRRVALQALSQHQHGAGYRDALWTLRRTAGSEQEALGLRRRAVSALTQLRDEESAPLFVDLLTDADRGIATASRVGLRVLTAHDFGFDRDRWLPWLAEHGRDRRIEWLIEGLSDARTNIRLLASRELARLTRFLPPLPETADRKNFLEAQFHYRRWWLERHPRAR